MKKYALRFYIISLFCVYTSTVCFSQNIDFQKIIELYPQEKAIFLEIEKNYLIDYKKGKVEIQTFNKSEMLHLRFGSEKLTDEAVRFSKFNEIAAIKAYTRIPVAENSSQYKKIEVRDFMTHSIESEGVFYDDVKEKRFIFPAIAPQVRTYLEYSEKIRDLHFLGGFFFRSYLPCLQSKLQIKVHKNIDLRFNEFNFDNFYVHFERKSAGKYWIYTWTSTSNEAYLHEELAPHLRYTEPHILLRIGKIQEAAATQEVLENIENLYHWYYRFIEKTDQQYTPVLSTLVDSITRNASDQKAKATLIFNWVQNNIKYVAIEDGMRGFVPDAAEVVCEKRYGDCKDMTTLLVQMLRIAGIKAYFVWIGTRNLPYSFSLLPSPAANDHAIACAYIDDSYIFLDATDSYLSFGFPSAFIQGKEALIAISPEKFEIKQVPVLSKEQNSITDTCFLTIEDRLIRGKSKMVFSGYPNVTAQKIITNAPMPEQKVREILEGKFRFFEKFAYTIHNLYDRQKNLEIDYEFTLRNHHKTVSNDVYINLHLNPLWKNEFIDSLRKSSIESHYKFNHTFVYVLEIPENSIIKYIPPARSYVSKYFGFSVSYQHSPSSQHIIMRTHLYNDFLMLPPSQFDEWNAMITELNEAYRESIMIEK